MSDDGRSGDGQPSIARLNYVEFPAPAFASTRDFYAEAFGWTLTDFGPSYASTMTGDTDIGLQGDQSDAPRAPLPVIAVDDLDAALAEVMRAGGVLTKPIFAFPGGRRFQVTDPSGNEIAVMQSD